MEEGVEYIKHVDQKSMPSIAYTADLPKAISSTPDLEGFTSKDTCHRLVSNNTRDRSTSMPSLAHIDHNIIETKRMPVHSISPDTDVDKLPTKNLFSISSASIQKAITLSIVLLILVISYMAWGFVFGNNLPEIVSLTSDKYSLALERSDIKWTASASDKEGDAVLYRFCLKGPATDDIWYPMTGWISNNSWIWSASSEDIGANQIKVQVRDGRHSAEDGFDAEKTASFTITKSSPIVRSLVPSLASPQAAGSEIMWIANAYDPAGGQTYYRFSLSGPSNPNSKVTRDWATDNRWIWKTKPTDVGIYQVFVEIRNENYVKPDEVDAYKAESFTLTNTPPEQLSLTPDKSSPQVNGTIITREAISSDPNGDIIYYRFLLNGPSTSNRWDVVQDWSINNIWTWVPSQSDIGNNAVKVQVRDDYPGDIEKFDAETMASYTIFLESSNLGGNKKQPVNQEDRRKQMVYLGDGKKPMINLSGGKKTMIYL